MTVTDAEQGVIEVRVNPEPALVATIRTIAADLGGRADFDLDAISDLRMAVDEACATLIALADPSEPMRCLFSPAVDHIRVQVSVLATSPDARVSRDGFGWRVLATLVDELQVREPAEGTGDHLAISLLKKAVPC